MQFTGASETENAVVRWWKARDKLRPEQQFLVLLALLAVVAITPFGLWRLWDGDRFQALVDALVVLTLVLMAALGARERWFRVSAALFALFYTLGVAAVVWRQGVDALFWVYPAATAVFFILRAREALGLSLISLVVNTTLVWGQAGPLQIATFVVTNFLVCLFAYLFAARMWSAYRRLTAEATSDPLTGVGNRRLLDDTLQAVVEAPAPAGQTLLMLDIDHFKEVNDQYGHATGDLCLQRLTRRLGEQLTADQRLYRYGGEEFMILIEGDLQQGRRLAEQIRAAVAGQPLIRELLVTVSLGVAELGPGQDRRSWLQAVDGAVYQAKAQGRNGVVLAPLAAAPPAVSGPAED